MPCALSLRSVHVLVPFIGAAMLQEQPPRNILYRYQRESGTSWLAVDRQTVREVVEVLIEQGVRFTEGMAIMDLHDAIAEQ